jgi:ketosteroid isomerase-like protein
MGGPMTSDDLLSAVARFYEAFEASDLNALSQVVTEDFIVDLPVLEHVQLDPEYRGLAGFRKLLVDRKNQKINYTRFDTQERMVDGTRVAVFGRTEGTAGAALKPFAHDWVHLFRFRGNRIELLKEYIDASEVSTALAP